MKCRVTLKKGKLLLIEEMFLNEDLKKMVYVHGIRMML